jgi:hypothetical protein
MTRQKYKYLLKNNKNIEIFDKYFLLPLSLKALFLSEKLVNEEIILRVPEQIFLMILF